MQATRRTAADGIAVAARTLRLPGAEETGPPLSEALAARETHDDEQLEESLLGSLTEDIEINERGLADKDWLRQRRASH